MITDQQGNARFSFQNNAGTVKIIQENSFYAFGESLANSTVTPPATPANHNLYNGGAERQDIFAGLPDYDMTYFRNYDPAIGRWTGVDPMAEGAESLSSYQYSGNNPVMFNDPLGDKIVGGAHERDGHVYDDDGNEIIRQAPSYTQGGTSDGANDFLPVDDLMGGDPNNPSSAYYGNNGTSDPASAQANGEKIKAEAQNILNDTNNQFGGFVNGAGKSTFDNALQENIAGKEYLNSFNNSDFSYTPSDHFSFTENNRLQQVSINGANQGGDEYDDHGRRIDMRSFNFSQLGRSNSMAAAVAGFTVTFKWSGYPQKTFNIGTIYVQVPKRIEWSGKVISAGYAAEMAAKAANEAADQTAWQFAYPLFGNAPAYLNPGADAQYNIRFIRLMNDFMGDEISGSRVRFVSPTDPISPQKVIYTP